MGFGIIHITDLHIDNIIDNEEKKIKSISLAVNKLKNIEGVLLLFTGDIAYSGQKYQYDAAKSFIKKLVVCLSKNHTVKVCLCPGNHDRLFPTDYVIDKSFISSINKSNYDCKFEENIHLMDNYFSFEKETSMPSGEINKIVNYYDINFGEKRIRVYSLNNSLLSSYYPKSLAGKQEAKENVNFKNIFIRGQYLDFPRLNNDYVFLISHLPIDYLRDENKNYLKTHFSQSIDAVFSGHIHDDEIKEEFNTNKRIIEFTSAAIDFKEMSGFSLLHVDGNIIKRKIYEYDADDYKYKELTATTRSITLPLIKSTKYGQILDNDRYNSIYTINVFDGTNNINVEIEKLFVFPRLTYRKYNNQIDIKSFDTFESKRAKDGVTRIQGDIHSGKSVFANFLFERYRQLGLLPILCQGKDLDNDIRNTIKWKMKYLYCKNNSLDDFDNVDKEFRILIIDGLDHGSRILFRNALKHFSSVIYLTPSGKDFKTSEEDDERYNFESFELEAFYYDKRVSLYEKVFNYISEINKDLTNSIVFDVMVKDLETKIKEMDFDNSLDPSNLVYITLNYIKRSGFNFSNSDAIYKARLQMTLTNALKERNYSYCTSEIAEIILSHVAMSAYEKNLSYFDRDLFVRALEFRNDIYGDYPIQNVDSFIQMLVEIEFIKRKGNDNGELAFFDRKKFAYYIAKFAVYYKHNRGNDTYLEMIVDRGIYKPLNLQILFSIASNYDYYSIPNFIISKIYDEVINEDVVDLNNLKSFFDKIEDNKKELQEIETSKSKRKEIREQQGLAEERSRKRYLEHKDDYFYYDESATTLKKIDDLANKIDIISVILNSFAGNLEKDPKSKLIEMLIRLPYSLINIFLQDTMKKISVIFVRLFDQLSKDPLKNIDYYYIKSCLIAQTQSIILSIFDYGTRMLRNKAIINNIKEMLEKNNDVMHKTQRLMLLSFAPDKELFVKEAEESIKKDDDKFIVNNARLIGRRFCFDNYDLVERKYGKFLNIVTKGNEEDKKAMKKANKIKK